MSVKEVSQELKLFEITSAELREMGNHRLDSWRSAIMLVEAWEPGVPAEHLPEYRRALNDMRRTYEYDRFAVEHLIADCLYRLSLDELTRLLKGFDDISTKARDEWLAEREAAKKNSRP